MNRTKIIIAALVILNGLQQQIWSQGLEDILFPVKGFCITAPASGKVDRFVKFIAEELAPRGVNTMVIIVDFNYRYESYPQLSNADALSKNEIRQIVDTCKKYNIRIIPQINLLGHQSFGNSPNNLLTHFPEFDETPHIKLSEKGSSTEGEGVYCKSYCPLHPDVHNVVFSLVDEICDVFECDAFHAGMDEVFYIGDDNCSRCSGLDKAELFASEVKRIREHLAIKNRELWIWGDRLIDGNTTGLGIWEASGNDTHLAIDMIPKDIVICDWHYERADLSPVYFAMKGFRVITCPWKKISVALAQADNIIMFRKYATNEMKQRYYGMLQTTWTNPESFINGFYGITTGEKQKGIKRKDRVINPWDTFRALYKRMNRLEKKMK